MVEEKTETITIQSSPFPSGVEESISRIKSPIDKETKMVKETDLDIESTPVKEVDIEKYIKSKLKSVFDDGQDTIEIRQITLRMAKMWDDKGHIYEAIDLFKKVLKEHVGTTEAKEAKEALTRYAKKFESEGRHHQAHALYNDIFL